MFLFYTVISGVFAFYILILSSHGDFFFLAEYYFDCWMKEESK